MFSPGCKPLLHGISNPVQQGVSILISLLEEGLSSDNSDEYQTPSEEVTNNSTDIKSLLHLQYPLHGAILIYEEHECVFAARHCFSVEVGDFHELFSACAKLINSGEVQR